MSKSELEFLVFPDEEKLYVELESFIRFLRRAEIDHADDELYTRALRAVSNYLETKQQDLLAEHILNSEAREVKDKDRLN